MAISASRPTAPAHETAAGRNKGIAIVVLGVTVGTVGAFIADLDRAWIAFLLTAVVVCTVLAAVRDATRFLGALFVLSLQADAAYRILYGRAGSDGMAFPLCVLIGVGWAASWWLSAERDQPRQVQWGGRLAFPIGLLFATALVSWLFSSERFVGTASLLYHLELYFVFWIALQLVQSKRDLDWVIQLLLVTLAIQCVVYYIQSAAGVSFTLEGDTIEQGIVPRPGGTVATNPAGFASFAIPLLMIAMARLLKAQRLWERRCLTVLVLMGVAAVGLTFTRVAWIGLGVAFAFLLATAWRRRLVPASRMIWVGAALAVMIVALAPTMGLRNEEAPLEDAYAERQGLMDIAFEVIRANPLVGVGPGAYPYVYKRYLPDTLEEQWLYTVHNEYLLRAAEMGIFGGLAWILLLVAAFRLARRIGRMQPDAVQTLGLGWSAGLLAVAWQMYWVPWDGFQYNALLWFLLGLSLAAERISAEAGRVEQPL